MMIALFLKSSVEGAEKVAGRVMSFFDEKGIEVITEDQLQEEHIPKIDYFLSLGGDGSILRIAHQYDLSKSAVVGVNLGHLGFMAEIPESELNESLQDLIDGKCEVENRLMLEARGPSGKMAHAINDAVVHRAQNPSLIELELKVNGRYFNTFRADGLIFATPNGSTAYSLAAGGPILSPVLSALCITPICAHTISNRPIVLDANATIEVTANRLQHPIEVIVDGLETISLQPGETTVITKSPKTFRLVSLIRNDYFATLRTKLGWSGSIRSGKYG